MAIGIGIGVGIVAIGIGIGVGIVVIGIGVGIAIGRRLITHYYVHLIVIQEVGHRKLKPLIAVFKVRNTAIFRMAMFV